ncbi:hypothetical protein [Aquabacterium sp.]|uniref:hypothetical protein n=1 Tax=Aquabacterium sp. TaxID=1872578 RepID=UPI0035B163B1
MPHLLENVAHASITFGVKTPRHLGTLPGGRGDVWSADVKAVRKGQFCKLFPSVLFVEKDDLAYVLGIEVPDGRSAILRADLANHQQQFILFLRAQTSLDAKALGLMARAFDGHEYGSEGSVTAAYAVARQVPLHLGVGYLADSGGYELIGIHQSDELIADARSTLPFDELNEF